jgi:hypothetical protein
MAGDAGRAAVRCFAEGRGFRLRWPWRHRQHRNRGEAEDLVGIAAHEGAAGTLGALRAHHDQLRLPDQRDVGHHLRQPCPGGVAQDAVGTHARGPGEGEATVQDLLAARAHGGFQAAGIAAGFLQQDHARQVLHEVQQAQLAVVLLGQVHRRGERAVRGFAAVDGDEDALVHGASGGAAAPFAASWARRSSRGLTGIKPARPPAQKPTASRAPPAIRVMSPASP